MKPEVDFLAWNSVFDDFRSISEVFPLNEMAMDGSDVSVISILDAAEALKAKLLLVYTEVFPTVHEAEIRGALYDVSSGRIMAVLHSDAYVEHPVAMNARIDDHDLAEEIEQRDPRLIGVSKFEESARNCLLALMANDDPAEPVVPEGWVPDREIERLIWPPLEDSKYRELRRRQ